jgi:hypothetical protein
VTTVTLIDGRTVSSASPEWRDECLQRHNHITAMGKLRGTFDRREYIAAVARKEGSEAADRLKREFLRVWDERKKGP